MSTAMVIAGGPGDVIIKRAVAAAVTTSVADGPLPVGEIVGGIIIVSAYTYVYWDDISQSASDAWSWMKGERGKTAKPDGTNNPWKHTKPHPTNPNKIQEKDGHTGKWKDKPKPSGWDDWWNNR